MYTHNKAVGNRATIKKVKRCMRYQIYRNFGKDRYFPQYFQIIRKENYFFFNHIRISEENRTFADARSYVDVDFYIVAFDGARLYWLARMVPASIELDLEGIDSGADDGSVSAVVRWFLAYHRPDAHAAGHCSLRDRHIESHHSALSVHAVSGARPRTTGASGASYLTIS